MSDDPRIAKIQALFAKANDSAATKEEAEAYTAKATELMIKWEIEEAQLSADVRLATQKIIEAVIHPAGSKIYLHELVSLGCAMARALGMRGAITKRSEMNEKTYRWINRDALMLVGFEGDVERFKLLFPSIVMQCQTEMARWAKDGGIEPWWGGTEKFQARRGFIVGFKTTVAQRLESLRDRQLDETIGTGTDLVLIDKGKQVDTYADDLGWKKGRPRTFGYSGVTGGMTAGNRADIGLSRFGAGAAARGSLEA